MGKSKDDFMELRLQESNEEYRAFNRARFDGRGNNFSQKQNYIYSSIFEIKGILIKKEKDSCIVRLSENCFSGCLAAIGTPFKLHFNTEYSFRINKIKESSKVSVRVVKQTLKTDKTKIKFLLNDIIVNK